MSASRPKVAAVGWFCAGLLILADASPGQAQVLSVDQSYESPRRFLAELKVGPYAPNIDAEFADAAPYEHIFGDGQNVMFTGELAVELWQGFGTLALGASLGYYRNSARAFLDQSADGTSPSTAQTRLAGETGINLLPAALLAIYRLDVLAQRWQIPIVPYVKAGLNYTLWWISKPGGDLATLGGKDAIGGSYGWQVNVGGAFLLDVLEPKAAKSLDVDLGINHTYLFFELVHVQTDRFGAGDTLQVGDTTWNGGLTFEF